MELYLYNTLTRTKEIFKPLRDNQVGFYCCGPTVYWFAHIGNLRTYIFEDILRRVLEYNGFSVLHIMNYTDVGHLTSDADTGEDKMEKGAKREGKTAWEIAQEYIDAFEKDAEALSILKPDRTPRATEHIQEQIDLIKILEQKGFTYTIDDGVYFDTSKLNDYGKLARLDIEGLKAGARIELVEGKKNPTDFALWKFSPKDQKRQMEWDSPWAPPGSRGKAKGFPGWHIECSAMSKKYLGEQFDIHCGGIDHLNVHHTNEVAQSEAAFGKIPARFWLHGEHLLIDEGKMAKSEGNLLTLQVLIDKGYSPIAYRYLTLTAHYRSKLNFTWESLSAAQSALKSLYDFYRGLNEINPPPQRGAAPATKSRAAASPLCAGLCAQPSFKKEGDSSLLKGRLGGIFQKYRDDFLAALNDDLNTPEAIAVMWKLIKDETITPADKKSFLFDFDKIFGLKLPSVQKIEIPQEIIGLANERKQMRQEKKWEEADEIRKKIEALGYKVQDSPEGPKIVKS